MCAIPPSAAAPCCAACANAGAALPAKPIVRQINQQLRVSCDITMYPEISLCSNLAALSTVRASLQRPARKRTQSPMQALSNGRVPHVRRGVPGFPDTQHQTRPRVRLSFKESRMEFDNATNLNRKSGVRGKKKTGAAHHCFLPYGRGSKCGCALLGKQRKKSSSSQVRWGDRGAPSASLRNGMDDGLVYPLLKSSEVTSQK